MDEKVKKILDHAREVLQKQTDSLAQSELEWEDVVLPEVVIRTQTGQLYHVWVDYAYGLGQNPVELWVEELHLKHKFKITVDTLKKEYVPYTPKNRSLFPKKD